MHPENFIYNGRRIPYYMHEEITNYLTKGIIEKGDFLWYVACNDLKNTFGSADNTNIKLIDVYVAYFYNEVPSNAWGSRENVEDWCNLKETERKY